MSPTNDAGGSANAGGSIRYMRSEILARYQAWALARRGEHGFAGCRDELWASYVDARDGRQPGSTLEEMRGREQGRGLVVAPTGHELTKKSCTRTIFK